MYLHSTVLTDEDGAVIGGATWDEEHDALEQWEAEEAMMREAEEAERLGLVVGA